MRPNLALGPIDSVAQYLLYLSIVVLGVLLPLLVQKWRTRREEARLVQRTLAAIDEELRANRRRTIVSRDSFRLVLDQLQRLQAHLLEHRARLLDPTLPASAAPADAELGINLALITDTAWDVARGAGALPLIPGERLTAFTRAYRMQDLFLADRGQLLATATRAALLDLPADQGRVEVLDQRIQWLTEGASVMRYFLGLAEGMISAYDEAISGASTPPAAATIDGSSAPTSPPVAPAPVAPPP
jgi:hypothetical protein